MSAVTLGEVYNVICSVLKNDQDWIVDFCDGMMHNDVIRIMHVDSLMNVRMLIASQNELDVQIHYPIFGRDECISQRTFRISDRHDLSSEIDEIIEYVTSSFHSIGV